MYVCFKTQTHFKFTNTHTHMYVCGFLNFLGLFSFSILFCGDQCQKTQWITTLSDQIETGMPCGPLAFLLPGTMICVLPDVLLSGTNDFFPP